MSTSPASILKRMKPLPPRLRLTHLRALIRQAPAGSARAEGLLALLLLLHDQSTAAARYENRDA